MPNGHLVALDRLSVFGSMIREITDVTGQGPSQRQLERLVSLATLGDATAVKRLRGIVRDRSNQHRVLPLLCPLALDEETKPIVGQVLVGVIGPPTIRAYKAGLVDRDAVTAADAAAVALVHARHEREKAKQQAKRDKRASKSASSTPELAGPLPAVLELEALETLLTSLEDGRIRPRSTSINEPVESLTLTCGQAKLEVVTTGHGFSGQLGGGFRNAQRLEAIGWRRRDDVLIRRWPTDPPSRVAKDVSDTIRLMFGTGSVPRLRLDGELLAAWTEASLVSLESTDRLDEDFDGPEDRVFGSVRSDSDLHFWANQVRPAAFRQRALRVPPSSPDGSDDIGWCLSFTRLNPTDTARLKADFAAAARVLNGGRSPGIDVARLVREAALVYVPAPDAYALFTADNLPREWMSDIRLPFPVTTLCFSSLFEMPKLWTRSLPKGPFPPAVSSYRQWFGGLSGGGALLGVTLVAEEDGTLSDLAIVHAAVLDHGQCTQAVNVPARIGDTHLEGIVRPLAGWLSEPRFTEDQPGVMIPRKTSQPRRKTATAPPGPTNAPSTIKLKAQASRKRRGSGSRTSVRSVHVRRGHWRRQRIGPRTDWHYEIRWVSPAWVTAGGPGEPPDHVYVLPPPVGSR